jgi:hypothetical protein
MAASRGDSSWWAVILIGVVLYAIANSDSDSRSSNRPSRQSSAVSRAEPKRISRDEAVSNHWEDVCEYLGGTEEIEACAIGGDCYALEADISSCSIDTVYFPNGGFLNVFAPVDDAGSASAIDTSGRMWEFTLDLDSYVVDEALEEWAASRNVMVER